MGLIAHTCVEATVRFGAELGYDITMVNIPNYATAVLPADEVVDAISS
jgi:ureidoacrylate peracid hydrolase